jgi:phage shock protein C
MTAERLYRKRINKVFGGVAAGLADYLNLDPVLIRVLFIILAFVNGIGLLLYIILWIVIPEDTTFYSYAGSAKKTSSAGINSDDEKTSTDENESAQDRTSSEYNPNFTMPQKSRGNGRIVFGSVLILIGVIFLAERFFPFFDFFDLLPIVLIVLGIMLITNAQLNRQK